MKKLIGFLLLFVYGCNSQVNEEFTISFDIRKRGDPLAENQIIRKHIIQLNNQHESLIGEVSLVDTYKNNYYILDRRYRKSIFLFDRTGNLITKTPIGKGPNEYIFPWTFYIDTKVDRVYIWDQATLNLTTCSLDLEPVSCKTIKDFCIWDMAILNSNTMLVYSQGPIKNGTTNTNKHYHYYLWNHQKERVKSYLEADFALSSYILNSPIYQDQENVSLIVPFDFNVYGIANGKISKQYSIDFGRTAIGKADQKKGLEYILDLVHNQKKVASIDNISNSNDYLSFSYFQNGNLEFIIYDKRTKRTIKSIDLVRNGIIPRSSLKAYRNNKFVAVINPKDLINYYVQYPSQNSREISIDLSDNPYLLEFEIVDI